MYLVPKKDLLVIDPKNKKPLPPHGKKVSGNRSYWARRIKCKECAESAALEDKE